MYKKGIQKMSMICYYLQADDETLQKFQSGNANPFTDMGDASIDIDKAWHTIHYILTGEVWDVPDDDILAQLVLGGEPINDEDLGYGPMRLLTKETVSQLADALEKWDEDAFRENFHMEDLTANEIYPTTGMDEEEEFFQYVWENFDVLKKFIKETSEKDLNVLTFLA